MKLNTVINKTQSLLTIIRDFYSSLTIYQPTFESYLASKSERVDKHSDMQKLPTHAREYLRGASDQLFHEIQVHKTLYVHEYEGVCYLWNDLPTADKGAAMMADKVRSAHIWWLKSKADFPSAGIPMAQVKPWGKFTTESENKKANEAWLADYAIRKAEKNIQEAKLSAERKAKYAARKAKKLASA